ncbi:tripartite tricarboxylate transporter TctB family protein [Halomonas sp. BM-2019]|uniref:tripartite tricarboxylate transporter TctB family protein n=1 Tax=Halomonas sp. BM-2019 TaxID=2811227 RepID=UPI001B3C2247|nr:MAG: tripartite tricarboxylate transporter TctB family protein [Halomonas sp. BM-2019]
MPTPHTRVVRQMRLWFSLFLFLVSTAYFFYGLSTLNFVTNIGRPGPGYFPAIVGGLLIVFTSVNLLKDLIATKRKELQPFRFAEVLASRQVQGGDGGSGEAEEEADRPVDVVLIVLCLTLLIGSITFLGGLLSMIVFMFVLMSIFNRKKLAMNVAYSIALPVLLYLLFDVLLNASLPRGVFGV